MKVHIDFETRSAVDLKKSGLHVYSRDKTTDLNCMAFAFDKHPVQIWKRGEPFPLDLIFHLEDGGDFLAHNAAFEFELWNEVGVKKYGWPRLPVENLHCTMATGYAMALPGSLENVAPALGIDQQKDMQGSRIMLQLAKPRDILADGTPVFWDESEVPDKYQVLFDYCKQDVEVERAAYERMLPLSPKERDLWLLDHKVNQRGVQVDTAAVEVAIKIVEHEKKRLDEEMRKVTGNAVATANATAQLKAYLIDQGLKVEAVAKADVIALLADKTIPPACRRALQIRQEGGKSSTSKLVSMISRTNSDGRVRGNLQYHGATTGRWAGRGVNVQNFPRPTMPYTEVEKIVNNLTKFPVKELTDNIDVFYGQPTTVISNCLRSFLTAAPGKDLIAMDFSAIEARVLAWLAGEEKKLEIFRTHGKLYEASAADIYKVALKEVTKDQRQIGKVAELALGFAGGVGAFQSMARLYGVEVADSRADAIKKAWRAANPKIVRYWYALEEAAAQAVRNPGRDYAAGAEGRQVRFLVKGSFLWCRLPSSRVLCYPYPRLELLTTPFGEKEGVTYMTEVTGRKWVREKLWSGLIAENITQAVSRDLLAETFPRLEAAKYPVVMHAHDEAVVEIEETFGSLKEVEEIFKVCPSWAKDLPLSAEGWRGKRYRK